MSLKITNEPTKEEWAKYAKAVEDYKNGKKDSETELYKCVQQGTITEEVYRNIVEQYRTVHRIHKEQQQKINKIKREHQEKTEKERQEKINKIKNVVFSAIAFLVLLDAMVPRLGDLLIQEGKGTAAFYLFVWFWAIYYIASSDSKKS